MTANAPPPVAVLVVDDDYDIREALSEVLTDEGYAVATAANGAEALEVLGRMRPDLILLDLNMPVMNGEEFRAAQRRDAKLSTIPTVVLAAIDRSRAQQARLDALEIVAKPVKLNELLALVKRIAPGRETALE